MQIKITKKNFQGLLKTSIILALFFFMWFMMAVFINNLVEKYGREYNAANIKKESEHSIYCKFGNKVLCCKHDLQIINMFKSPENFEEIMEQLLETYGIETDQ